MTVQSGGFGELRAGSLGVRIATTSAEIAAAQHLRYRVFYSEMGAHPNAEMLRVGRDFDRFDAVADHLLVVDHGEQDATGEVVATYRLIRAEAAEKAGGFYSADEFDLTTLLASRQGVRTRVMELGRSCVHPDYRTRAAMQLLWRGIAAYVFHYEIELMFGCASLPGTDPDAVAAELTYLHAHHLAPAELRPRALRARYIEMARCDPATIDPRAALARLPPLIKGYLRLGAFVGDGAVIDPQFNTIDVVVVVKTDLVTEKYYRHYERQARETA